MEHEKLAFRVGDHVDCVILAEEGLPSIGTIVEVRSNANGATHHDDYVVQLRPTVLGIFQAAQLRHLSRTHEDLQELLAGY